MKVVYDIHVESREDEYVGNLHAAMQLLSEATRPIAYLIESLPLGMTPAIPLMNKIADTGPYLSFLWPGALGKRDVGDMRRVTEELTSAPFVAAKAFIVSHPNDRPPTWFHVSHPSFVGERR